jgi:hypothetical protein
MGRPKDSFKTNSASWWIRQLEPGETYHYHHANCQVQISQCSRYRIIRSTAYKILGASNYIANHVSTGIVVERLLPGQRQR